MEQFLEDQNTAVLPDDYLAPVLSIVLKAQPAVYFDKLVALTRVKGAGELPPVKRLAIYAVLGQSPLQQHKEAVLEMALTEVKTQDVQTPINGVWLSAGGEDVVWTWFVREWRRLFAKCGDAFVQIRLAEFEFIIELRVVKLMAMGML